MYYSTGCAFNTTDLFSPFNKDKLKITSNLCEKVINNRHKQALINKIFQESFKIIINDIIDNNVTFELPVGSAYADIHVTPYSFDDFKAGRRNGKWMDIDFLKSGFVGNVVTLNMYKRDGRVTRVKPIHISGEQKQRLTENTNNQNQYC